MLYFVLKKKNINSNLKNIDEYTKINIKLKKIYIIIFIFKNKVIENINCTL